MFLKSTSRYFNQLSLLPPGRDNGPTFSLKASGSGSCAVAVDENQAVVLIRSRLWPGYTSYARANTNIFGGVYIGDGVCNQDLPFMI